MLVRQEQTKPCEVELEIQADPETVTKIIARVYKEFGKHTAVPGFRKGKAPRHLIEQVVDKQKVREYVIDEVLEEIYEGALEESGVDAFAQGSVDDVQFELDSPDEPFIVKARVPLAPKVELGQYTELEVEKKQHVVTDEELDSEIQAIMSRNVPPVEVLDRSVENGDILQAIVDDDFEAQEHVCEDENCEHDHSADKKRPTTIEVGKNLPEFDAALLGMNIGETKIVEVTYPEDFQNEEMRGESKKFKVTVEAIRKIELPELTDDYVQTNIAASQTDVPEEEKIDTVDKFRQKVRETLQKSFDDMSAVDVENSIVQKILEASQVDFPEIMLQRGIKARFDQLQESLKKNNISIQDYLTYKRISADDLFNQFSEEEGKSLITGLVLREIVDKEDIQVGQEDIDQEIEAMAVARQVPVETIRAFVDSQDASSEISNKLLQKKLLEFLKASANIKIVET